MLHSDAASVFEVLEDTRNMEQDGQAHEGQPQQAQHDQQGGVGSNPQQNPQEQAKVASQEAVVAQQEAQEAIKRAYVKQMAAQEKAERASQQVVTEQETAKKVATEAASEAAEKAANEQRERGAKEAHDMSIANLAAQSALASLSASQSANQQRPVNPGYQSGFVAYSSRDQNSASATQGQGGNLGVQQGQSPQPSSDSDSLQSAQRCQQMLLQGANQMAQHATAQMAAAQNLAAGSPDPQYQQVARQQATAAQDEMEFAYKIAAAAQAPDTAVQAAAALPNLFNAA